MFLQNIHIAAGPMPEETGNLQQDVKELRIYLDRLLRALEQCFDQITQEINQREETGHE